MEFDNNKFNKSLALIQLDDMFTTGVTEFKEVNEKTTSANDEAQTTNRKTKVQNIIALLLESRLVDNKEKGRLGMHYGFNLEDIIEEIESLLFI